VLGTLKDTVDELAAERLPIGVVGLTAYRPFPVDALREALGGAERVVVLERSVSPGVGGPVTADVRSAVAPGVSLHTVVAGLGGRPVTRTSLARMLRSADQGDLPPLSFLDLDLAQVERTAPRDFEEARR
jgi:pyruvate ferredoxin oxidoreductase alpha subunit